MHYYRFHIGDYRKDTGHLTPIEHYIYRELIDWYFLDEKPVKYDPEFILRKMRLNSEDHANALKNVVTDFFLVKRNTLIHKRIDREILAYKDRSKKAKESANARWKKQPKNTKSMRTHSDRNADGEQTKCENDANHKPITNNQYKNTNPLQEEVDTTSVVDRATGEIVSWRW